MAAGPFWNPHHDIDQLSITWLWISLMSLNGFGVGVGVGTGGPGGARRPGACPAPASPPGALGARAAPRDRGRAGGEGESVKPAVGVSEGRMGLKTFGQSRGSSVPRTTGRTVKSTVLPSTGPGQSSWRTAAPF